MRPEDAIRAAIESFNSAYRSKDLEALAATYSEDLIKDQAGAPPQSKSETIARLRQVFELCDTDIQVDVDETVISADLAYVRGSFGVTLKPLSGHGAKTIRRRYIEIWRNEDGAWRVTRTMDNEPA